MFSPEKLRARRNELDLTAEEAAELTGLTSQSAYSRYELDSNPSVTTLFKLAAGLDLLPCYLLEDERKLEHYRVIHEWTIGETADRLGLDRSERYGRIESGEDRPDDELLLRMSRTFKAPLRDIEAAAAATAEAYANKQQPNQPQEE